MPAFLPSEVLPPGAIGERIPAWCCFQLQQAGQAVTTQRMCQPGRL